MHSTYSRRDPTNAMMGVPGMVVGAPHNRDHTKTRR
jgi:hypothetical protein